MWRYTCGQKGINRITVYERPGRHQIYIQWFDLDGRHRVTLRSQTGHPVTSRADAIELAEDAATKQATKRNIAAMRSIFGDREQHTLTQLLDRMHSAKEAKWSRAYKAGQERRRAFWLSRLGEDHDIAQTPDELIQSIVRTAGKGWSPRTQSAYLRYMVDAFAFGHRKLKWLRPDQALTAVEFPKSDERDLAYTLQEVQEILDKLHDIDAGAAAIGEVAFCTGRRLTAIRTLRTDAYDGTSIRFPQKTDKARKGSVAALSPQAIEAIEKVKGPTYLLGNLDHATLRRAWRDAEKRAGVDHVTGRAWHGIKRVYATMTQGLTGRDRQSGTLNSTLESVYRQDWMDEKLSVAERMGSVRTAPTTDTKTPPEIESDTENVM